MNKYFLRFVFIVFAILPYRSFAGYQEVETSKIAVVDVEFVLENSVAMGEVKKAIGEISEKIQSEMSKKELELKTLEAELSKQKNLADSPEIEQKILSFNKTVSSARKLMHKRKASLEKAHNKALATVHNSMIEAISNIAKEKGLSVVFPSNQLLFVTNELNITKEVMDRLNDKLPSVTVDYKFDN